MLTETFPRPSRPTKAVCLVALFGVLTAAEASSAADLSGRWEGRWVSCVNGHDGTLRASLSKLDDGRYCAEFSGTFRHVLPFRYTVVLQAEENAGGVVLRGESDLGFLAGGTFSYEATVKGSEFNAAYTSCNDHGRFEMRRSCHCRCCN